MSITPFHVSVIVAIIAAAIGAFIFLNGGGWIGLVVYCAILTFILIGAAT